MFIAYQEKLEVEVPKLVEMMIGLDIAPESNLLVTVGVMLLAIVVVDKAVERFMPGKSVERLKNEYRKKLKELSKLSGKTDSEIDELIRESMLGKFNKSLLKALFSNNQK
jgi:hypothetical protein